MTRADPTAAERARRYRERRRERELQLEARRDRDRQLVAIGDVAETPVLEALGTLVAELVLEVRELRAELAGDRGKRVETVEKRDASRRHAAGRDVTKASRSEAARARVREGAETPTGSLGADERERHAVVSIEPRLRILALLEVARAPASADAIGDELELGTGLVLGELVELERLGRVERIPPADPGRDRLRWRRLEVAAEPTVTISCSSYRAHALLGHRWDPGAGRFRCYVCEPDGVSPTA